MKSNRRTPDQSTAVWETSCRDENASVSGCLCHSSLLRELWRCDAAGGGCQHGLKRKDQHTLQQFFHPFPVAFHLLLELISSPLSSAFLLSIFCIHWPYGPLLQPFPQVRRALGATVFLFNISERLEDVLFTTPGHVQWLTQAETEHNMSAGESKSWGHRWGMRNTQSHTKNVCVYPSNAPTS